MSHIIFSFWLMAAGSGALAANSSQEPAFDPPHNENPSQSAKAQAAGVVTAMPVQSVIRLHRLPDGTLVQRCDVVPAAAVGASDPTPRGEWIQVPEARIR